VKALRKPVIETPFSDRKVNIADTCLLEAEFVAPGDDLRFECGHIGIAVLV
jgi:hypothetical protein